MELGKHIKRYRAEHGLSQEDLATKVFVARQTVSNWETDKTYPDVESLLLLSAVFDVTIDELIKGDVEAMEETIKNDWKKMSVLSWGGLALAILGVVLCVGGISFWDWSIVPSALLGLVLMGGAMTMITLVERMKKQRDLITYRELVAFSKGGPIDRDNPRSQNVRSSKGRIYRVLGSAIILMLGVVAGYYGYVFFG